MARPVKLSLLPKADGVAVRAFSAPLSLHAGASLEIGERRWTYEDRVRASSTRCQTLGYDRGRYSVIA